MSSISSKRGVAGDAVDAGQAFVVAAGELDVLAGGEVAQVGVLDADLDGLAAGGDQVEVAAVEVHVRARGWAGAAVWRVMRRSISWVV